MDPGPTLVELRELSAASRAAARRGFLALAASLLLFPLSLAAAGLSSSLRVWSLAGGMGLAGCALVWYAHAAGRERGVFRRVFRRLRLARKGSRMLVPQAAEVEAAPRAR